MWKNESRIRPGDSVAERTVLSVPFVAGYEFELGADEGGLPRVRGVGAVHRAVGRHQQTNLQTPSLQRRGCRQQPRSRCEYHLATTNTPFNHLNTPSPWGTGHSPSAMGATHEVAQDIEHCEFDVTSLVHVTHQPLNKQNLCKERKLSMDTHIKHSFDHFACVCNLCCLGC